MSRRSAALEHDHYGKIGAGDQGTDGLGLFDAAASPARPSWAETWASLPEEVRKYHRDRWQQQLLPLVLEAAKSAGPLGITAAEVITLGADRSILWTDPVFVTKYPRVYAWVGPWLALLAKKGNLVAKTHHVEGHGTIHLRRESDRRLSHGNSGLIYLSVDAELAHA